MGNLDLDLLRFIVTTFTQYYPKLFDAILVHELPYLLQYVFKLVQSWLPEEDRKFFHLTTKKTLRDFIGKEQLPSFLHGTNAQPWSSVPDDHQAVLGAHEFVAKKGGQYGMAASSGQALADKLKYLHAHFQ